MTRKYTDRPWITLVKIWIPISNYNRILEEGFLSLQTCGYTRQPLSKSSQRTPIKDQYNDLNLRVHYDVVKPFYLGMLPTKTPRFHGQILRAKVKSGYIGGECHPYLRFTIEIHKDINRKGKHTIDRSSEAISECYNEGLRLATLFPKPPLHQPE